ncbi:unnamed protein product, partial [marine sediment metagenome]
THPVLRESFLKKIKYIIFSLNLGRISIIDFL